MAVNISMGKQKPAAAAKQVATPVVEAAIEQAFDPEVDELAALLDWQAKQAKTPKAVRLAELLKKFKEAASSDDYGEDDDVKFSGKEHDYVFGKKSTERKVTAEGVGKFFDKVGEEAFKEVVTVPIGALDKYVPKVEQDDYLKITRGSRSPKLTKKTPEA